MVARQVFAGVSAGALTAVFALFLTIPRPVVEAAAPSWLLERLPQRTSPDAAAQVSAEPIRSETEERPPAPVDERQLGSGASSKRPSLVAGLATAPLGSLDTREKEELDEALLEPLARPEPRADVLDPELYVAALSKQTIIRESPDPESRIIGFARTGALLRRAPIPASKQGCPGGWYRVEPDGYICIGKAATLDPEHPIIQLASLQPDRSLPMPYPYGKSRYPTPPLYTKIPTEIEQAQAEADLVGHKRKNFGKVWEEAADTPPPSLLSHGERVPRPFGYPPLEHDFMTGRALVDSAFAFIDLFETEDRRWGLTADLSILPLDRVEPVRASEFYGVVLAGNADLPIAFMRDRSQYLYTGSAQTGVKPVRAIAFREAFRLTGEKKKIGGIEFYETRDGQLIKNHPRLVVISAREQVPHFVRKERSWIEVSILNQTLVAYRGAEPIFATLVSTGKDGLGDPETTHSTPQGTFLIHTKHVTSTMSGDAADDEYDLRDVPYVQFFKDGYAFHAAFWHDVFGQPKSHGCINLSPPDARHLFSITEPPVPLRWHSALSREGTLVYIHP